MIRLVRLLLAGLLALLVPALAPPFAYAAADDPQVTIAIDSFDPAVPARDSTITIRGSVTNTTGEPLSLAQVLLWRDWSPITTSDGLTSALGSAGTNPYGGRVTEEGAYQNLTPDEAIALAPGASAPFEVHAAVSALELPKTGGIYLMGVHVVGKVGRRANATVGRARVFVPLPQQGAPTWRVDVPTLVVLSSRPAQVADGVLADDHLADELSITGRLTKLMVLAKRPDVAYAIDPALLQSLRMMANGYQVRQPDGAMVPGAGSALARRWLADYDTLDDRRGFRTPFAMPDLTTIAHQSLEDTFTQVVAAGDQIAEVAALPLLGVQFGGDIDAATIPWLERLKPALIVATDARSDQPLVTPISATPIVHVEDGLTEGGPGPDPRTTAVHRRQRLLAETWVDAATSRPPVVQMVATTEAADAVIGAQAPWIHRVPLTQLLAQKPAEWSGQLDYSPAMRAAELSATQVGEVHAIARALTTYAQILVDPAARERQTNALLARSVSSWWRGAPAAHRTWTAPLLAQSEQLLTGSQVGLTAQKTVIMSGQTGSFPMTVTNRLDQPIRVAIDFASDQPQRLSFDRHNDIVVAPGQSTTVNITGHAAANGPVTVNAQVVTPGGAPIGRRVRMTVNVTNFGFVGWVIVVASGIVLAGATAFRIRQVARERVTPSETERSEE